MQRAAFHNESQNKIYRIQVFMSLFHHLIATEAKKKINGHAESNYICFGLGNSVVIFKMLVKQLQR